MIRKKISTIIVTCNGSDKCAYNGDRHNGKKKLMHRNQSIRAWGTC